MGDFVFAYTLSVLAMIFLPVVLAAWQHRRVGSPWLLFTVGVITFLGSQVVHLPLNHWLGTLGWLPEAGEVSTIPIWRTALLLGLTAGLCEELARAAGYAVLKRYRKFSDGVMMGLGHGGIEAMIFGGVLVAATVGSLLTLVGQDLTLLNLPSAQFQTIQRQVEAFTQTPWAAAVPLLERCLAIVLQVILSLLVWRGFEQRKPVYVLIAVVYHAAVDMLVSYFSMQGEISIWVIYLALVGCIVPGAVWAWRVYSRQPVEAHPSRTPFPVEFRLYLAAFRKELLEQWRSKRLLIVGAVFAIFGMMSPLFAYFTPEILKMVEGAEMFADLIPEPSMVDAMAQYLKNITQFGFLLAVLLGMGAVAGEKERNIIPIILSKPLPRWAFLLAKFSAQALVYLGGFVLAGVGAYFYTWYLFGLFPVGRFIAINLLLLAWLLPFAAVTLLGSTLGKTTSGAAGYSIVGAVLLLLSGSIPVAGALFPPALAAWAGQLGAVLGPVPSNPGALALALVIVVVLLTTAVGVFEQQEL